MTLAEVKESVCTIVEDESALPALTGSESFEQLSVDSMDFLSILLATEKRLGVRIPDAQRVQIRTVADLADCAWRLQC